jgi:hypothetical protein
VQMVHDTRGLQENGAVEKRCTGPRKQRILLR